MSKLPLKQRKEWAKLLFTSTSDTQKEIAARVCVTEKTLSDWINKEKWRKLKASLVITKKEELGRIYNQIFELNTAIESRQEGERYATNREADTLSKLAASAKSLEIETSVAEIINVFIDFTDWLRNENLALAQQLIELQDEYIKTKLR